MNRNESVWPGFIFLGTWWALTEQGMLIEYAFLGAFALWFVGLIAVRMFSSAAQQHGIHGWWLLVQVAAWYALALWLAPFDLAATILLLWGVATPLLLIGNLYRRTYERFPPIQAAMHVVLNIVAVAALGAVPLLPRWIEGRSYFVGLGHTSAAAAAAALCLFYGWRLGAPMPGGAYDARLGTTDSFRMRGLSHES